GHLVSSVTDATKLFYFLISSSVLVSRQSFGAPFFFDVIHQIFRPFKLVGFKWRLLLSTQNAVPPAPVILPGVVAGLGLFLRNLGRNPFVYAFLPILFFRHVRDVDLTGPVGVIF